MPASTRTIKEFLVGIKYKQDQNSYRQFTHTLGGLRKTIELALGGLSLGGVVDALNKTAESLAKVFYEGQQARTTAKNLMRLSYAANQVGVAGESVQGMVTSLGQLIRSVPPMTGVMRQLGGTSSDTAKAFYQIVQRYHEIIKAGGSQVAERALLQKLGLDPNAVYQLAKNWDAFNAAYAKFGTLIKSAGIGSVGTMLANSVQYTRQWQTAMEQLDLVWDNLATKIMPLATAAVNDLVTLFQSHRKEIDDFFAHLQTSLAHLNSTQTWDSVNAAVSKMAEFLHTAATDAASLVGHLRKLAPLIGMYIGARFGPLGMIAGAVAAMHYFPPQANAQAKSAQKATPAQRKDPRKLPGETDLEQEIRIQKEHPGFFNTFWANMVATWDPKRPTGHPHVSALAPKPEAKQRTLAQILAARTHPASAKSAPSAPTPEDIAKERELRNLELKHQKGQTHSPFVEIWEARGVWSGLRAWLQGFGAHVPWVRIRKTDQDQLAFHRMMRQSEDVASRMPRRLGEPAATGSPSMPTRQEQKRTIEEGLKFFMSKGLTRAQASGVVGRLAAESGGNWLNPNAVNKISGAYGIAQWLGSRAPAAHATHGSLKKQLDLVWHELTTTEQASLKAIEAAKTPYQAGLAMGKYERANDPAFTRRAARFADKIAQHLSGMEDHLAKVRQAHRGLLDARATQRTLSQPAPAATAPLAAAGGTNVTLTPTTSIHVYGGGPEVGNYVFGVQSRVNADLVRNLASTLA